MSTETKTLDDLDSSKTEWLKFNTDKLLSMLDLPTTEELQDDINEWEIGYGIKDDDIYATTNLTYAEREEGGEAWFDQNDKEVSEEALEEIRSVYYDAHRFGTEAKVFRELFATLESTLDQFSNNSYEYRALGENYVVLSGKARGIVGYDIKHDTSEIEVSEDMLHIINDVLSGVGMFEPEYEIGELFNDIQKLFHQLSSYWEVYSERKQKLDLDNVEDFDKKYWWEELKRIEKGYGLKL